MNDVKTMDHPSERDIELFALGTLDDDAIGSHLSSCDACATKLAAEARLELALEDLHAHRAGARTIARPPNLHLYLAPVFAAAAAAAVLFFLRGRAVAPVLEVRAESTPAASSSAAAARPADLEAVLTKLQPQFKRCINHTVETGAGEVLFVVVVATDGRVASMTIESQSNMTDEAVQCLLSTIHAARFQPASSPATFRLPIRFVANR